MASIHYYVRQYVWLVQMMERHFSHLFCAPTHQWIHLLFSVGTFGTTVLNVCAHSLDGVGVWQSNGKDLAVLLLDKADVQLRDPDEVWKSSRTQRQHSVSTNIKDPPRRWLVGVRHAPGTVLYRCGGSKAWDVAKENRFDHVIKPNWIGRSAFPSLRATWIFQKHKRTPPLRCLGQALQMGLSFWWRLYLQLESLTNTERGSFRFLHPPADL